ncbi:MAG: tRNA pseudouridine(55) synthase TruB [Microcystaceae cyanobacterium]
MLGFINLNKPQGMTSHDCVAKMRKLLKIKRIGHGGTLDPLATGVLPIGVGKATRLLSLLLEQKVYRAKIRFGVQTTTDDLEGENIHYKAVPHLTLEEIKIYLPQFIGKIKQIPPAYSAIQKDGKRLYELARKGEKVDVPEREVDIKSIDILNWNSQDFPELEVKITCGTGTYIRAIARDLGDKLKVGGTLAFLERTESGGLKLEESMTLEEIESQLAQDQFKLLDPDQVLSHLIMISLGKNTAKRWGHGQGIPWEFIDYTLPDLSLPIKVQVWYQSQDFLGIGQVVEKGDQKLLLPKIVV